MDRRSFICAFTTLLVLAGSLVARAQTATTVRRIGWLYSGTQSSASEREEEIAPLRELGWIEGRNLLVERRYSGNNRAELLLPLAEELVRLKVELIVTAGHDRDTGSQRVPRTLYRSCFGPRATLSLRVWSRASHAPAATSPAIRLLDQGSSGTVFTTEPPPARRRERGYRPLARDPGCRALEDVIRIGLN